MAVLAPTQQNPALDPEVLVDQPHEASGFDLAVDASSSPLAQPTVDELYEALVQVEGQADADRVRLVGLLKASFPVHDDWELQELAFAAERRIDPQGHRAHVLALACSPTSPVGSLVGALSSAGELDGATQDELLRSLASSQSAAVTAGLGGLEAVQRRDLAEGAVAERVRRLPFATSWDWLQRAEGIERELLIRELDRQGLLENLSQADQARLRDLEASVGLLTAE